ncbi:MAG: DMT family transporter [Lactobacillaceae bacterium]|jgi:drug/metabolite transporter (DMT)-like permease|nr:DMT family transporter [Lactobacillaceae bacterium]
MNPTHKKRQGLGTILALLSGIMWAISGIFGQMFFTIYHGNAFWITTSRLLIAGTFLLTISAIRNRSTFFAIWRSKQALKALFFYAILGIVLVQLTFYLTIQYANASTATVLQFTGPLFILAYAVFWLREKVSLWVILFSLTTILGVFLVVTNGNINTLQIKPIALIMGITSAFAVATYTISPKQIIMQFGAINVTGWGMLIGGIFMNFFYPVWKIDFKITPQSITLALAVGIVGTAMAFLFSMAAIKHVSPLIATLAGATEPILSTLLSIWLFGLALLPWEIVGIVVIILSVLLISILEMRK